MRKRFLRIILPVLTVVSLAMLVSAPALVWGADLEGPNTNNLNITLGVNPNLTINNTVIVYNIAVTNRAVALPNITADAEGIVITFFPPGPDGQPIATPTYTSAPFNMAAGDATVQLPDQPVLLALNPGVIVAVGRIHYTGVIKTYPIDQAASGDKDVPVTIMYPGTDASMSVSAGELPAGGETVTLDITDYNSGTAPLDNPSMVLDSSPVLAGMPMTLTKTSTSYVGGDADDNGVFDIGEIWQWKVDVFVDKNVTFTVVGHGFDQTEKDITFPEYPGERAQVSVIVRHETPALSTTGIGLMLGGFVAAIALFVVRKVRRSPLAG